MLKDLLEKSPSLAFFGQKGAQETSLLIENLWSSAKAALISLLRAHSSKHILILSAGAEDELQDDLSYFGLPNVLDFPSWETLPGEEILPSPDIVGKRFEVLRKLLEKEPKIILCPLQACLQKLPLPKRLSPLCRTLAKQETLPFHTLPSLLEGLGYRRVPVVSDKGEYAIRGGILDLFPLSLPDPYRIEFFGDVIDEIRRFDPISQKSIGKVDAVDLLPASEVELLKNEATPATLFDYLGKETLIIFNEALHLEDRLVALKNLPGAKSRFFMQPEEFFNAIQPFPLHFWSEQRMEELSDVTMPKREGRAFYSGKTPLQPLSFSLFGHTFHTKRYLHPFASIGDYFSASENRSAGTTEEILHGISRHVTSSVHLHLICANNAEEQALRTRLKSEKIPLPPATHFDKGYLSSGFALPEGDLILLPTSELSHRTRPRRQKWRTTYHTPASEFHALVPGDIVVHFHSGIGRYLGTEKRPNHLGTETEFLVIEYAEASKLYVPVSQSHLVSRYIGAKEEVPSFSALGSNRWHKIRTQAQQAVLGYAQQLLQMQAERSLTGGFVFPEDSQETLLFEEEFPFVETEDQLQAIAEIKKEMMSDKSMDRLICGDVGYGKTEVAMRAAFKAVIDGKKQVALLVPTTVLAMQHFETLKERMQSFPIQIACLSRFRSAREIQETLKALEEGSVDIVVGTHRMVSKDVRFKNLGLIIIDEEQRFGVRAKEHLKALKAGVDCLTLSATPIPRTLYLSLVGAKEISVINTPPQDRLPIKSIIAEKDPTLVQNALLRELSRDGQAFFIHNRVETLFQVTEELQKLLPEAKIVTGHGQMSPDELDSVFHAFKSGEADIFVATTIIENGIDIPNANTILIDRADTFGLADLYQMRGRVGRWNRPAYAYFLIPKQKTLPELTRKRLYALAEASGYGAGMKIAMRDLEIRGAGDILGTQQSGQISSVGFHLYCKLLKRAIDAMRKKTVPTFTETKMEFSYDASLPDSYINEPSLRMEIYHRLGEATSLEEIDAILAELKDRFGPYPLPVLWLYHLSRIRLFASSHHFTLLKFGTHTLTTEKLKGKETLKKTFPLPKIKRPDELEAHTLSLLKNYR